MKVLMRRIKLPIIVSVSLIKPKLAHVHVGLSLLMLLKSE